MIKEGFCWKCGEEDKTVAWVTDADGGWYSICICKECAEELVEEIEEKEE